MFFTERRFLRLFDGINFLIILALVSIGLLFVLSATYKPDIPYSIFFKKQAAGVIAGIGIYFICSFIDYRTLMRWGYVCYFIVLGLLVFTVLKGSIALGGQRWISVGLFKFQPSEIAKFFFPLFVAQYLSTTADPQEEYTLKNFAILLAVLVTSTLLIRKQPDLGTALIVLFSGLILLWLAGLRKRFFIGLACTMLITAPLTWHFLKPYQKKRIEVFLGYGDAKKERYQIEQSKIAIGSGGLKGKGYLQGTQNKLLFLPESRTDFIFSVICEEWGLLGALFILFLYGVLFVRSIVILICLNNRIAQLLGAGLLLHIILSAVINIGMVTGLLPIVGITLPLLSYGISSLWITFASLGLLQSISIHHQ